MGLKTQSPAPEFPGELVRAADTGPTLAPSYQMDPVICQSLWGLSFFPFTDSMSIETTLSVVTKCLEQSWYRVGPLNEGPEDKVLPVGLCPLPRQLT